MESRLALALALSLGILVGFQVLFPPKPQPASAPAAAPATAAAPASGAAAPAAPGGVPAASADVAAAAAAAPGDPGPVVDVTSDLFHARFQSRGGRLVGFDLAKYKNDPAPGDGPYDLIRQIGIAPLGVLWRAENGNVVDDRAILYDITATAPQVRPGLPVTVTMRGQTPTGATITKTVLISPTSYVMDFKVTAEGLPATALGVGWSRQLHPHKARADVEGAVGYFDGKLHSFDASVLKDTQAVEGKASWAGYAEHYFLAAYIPDGPQPLKLVASASDGSGHAALWTDAPTTSVHYGIYLGPKSPGDLEQAGNDLVQAIDLGWFWFIAKPLLVALRAIHAIVGNYGWAIILLTVAVRMMFYPINKKQIEAMKGMQRIQPEVKKIQERYQDDRGKMNEEMMELYRRHKVNPLAGCLPMLVQLPVFIGLYNVLLQSIDLRHAPFIGWMHDLSQPDRLGTISVPFVEPAGIPVMTLLMGASMILQQKMTPSTADPAQQRMMMVMPVVFTVMFVNFPAGLVLYWLSNNLLSIAQQWLSNRQSR
ncbi:MAG TPA: membrane protein insertase YidC [Candidatus Binatia bacterium]